MVKNSFLFEPEPVKNSGSATLPASKEIASYVCFCCNKYYVTGSVVEPDPVLFGRSRCEGPAPGSGSTLDKTEEILNDVLSIRFIIDKCLLKTNS